MRINSLFPAPSMLVFAYDCFPFPLSKYLLYLKRSPVFGRFSKKPEPVTARRQLQYVRQQVKERLEDFAHKVYVLALDGKVTCL
jgi:hypothetical protein